MPTGAPVPHKNPLRLCAPAAHSLGMSETLNVLFASDQCAPLRAVLASATASATLAARHLEGFDPAVPPKFDVRHGTTFQTVSAAREAVAGRAASGPRDLATALLDPTLARFRDAERSLVSLPAEETVVRYIALHPRAAVTVHLDRSEISTVNEAAAVTGVALTLLVLRNPAIAAAFASKCASVNLATHLSGIDRLVQNGPPGKVIIGNARPIASAWSSA